MEEEIDELKEQIDAAADASDMIEELSEKVCRCTFVSVIIVISSSLSLSFCCYVY